MVIPDCNQFFLCPPPSSPGFPYGMHLSALNVDSRQYYDDPGAFALPNAPFEQTHLLLALSRVVAFVFSTRGSSQFMTESQGLPHHHYTAICFPLFPTLISCTLGSISNKCPEFSKYAHFAAVCSIQLSRLDRRFFSLFKSIPYFPPIYFCSFLTATCGSHPQFPPFITCFQF